MNALVLHEPGKISLETVPKPNAAPGSVVVKVLAAPMWDYVVRYLPIDRTSPLNRMLMGLAHTYSPISSPESADILCLIPLLSVRPASAVWKRLDQMSNLSLQGS